LLNIDDLKISNHAKERYAERILDKDDKNEINKFIVNNEEKIFTDISKMIEYGELIYSGSPINKKAINANICDIYMRHNWVVIVDHNKSIVITLFNVDLGLDNQFNLDYCQKMKEKLNKQRAEYNNYKQSNADKLDDINNKITEYHELIKYHKSELAKINADLDTLEKTKTIYMDSNKTLDMEMRKTVSQLIGLKYF